MRWSRLRPVCISLFVAVWVAVFHYETLRLNYLSPLAGRALPKLKFLYPPAGWIMFFTVDRGYGFAEVYGLTDGPPALIDPHRIFQTRAVLYDNIRRNVLVSVLSAQDAPRFCAFLARKFPQYPAFAVVYGMYPDVVEQPERVLRQVAYECP
jgi:hypothetical protein